MSEGAEGFPFRFECRRTGNCCARPGGVVRVTADEVARIASHLSQSEASVRALYVAATGDRLRDAPGGACVFLERGRPAACRIHPVRPERCRSWPFWPELLDPQELGAARRFCPGIRPRDDATG
jgi:Fe-S-cluster containining protein